MRRARLPLAVLLGATLAGSAGPAAAQGLADATRPCKPGDLLGTWKLIAFGPAVGVRVDPSDPAFSPHQEFVFARDATVRHVASQTPIADADHRALLAGAAPGTWAVDPGGRLLLLRAGTARLEQSACLVLLKEVVDPKHGRRSLPGDILLTNADAADKPLFRRQLRKLDGPGE